MDTKTFTEKGGLNRQLFLLIICSLIIFLHPQSLKSQSVLIDFNYYDGVNYRIDTNSGTATVGDNKDLVKEDLVIPDYIWYEGKKYNVTEIEDEAFERNKQLKGSLTIGNSVTKIGNNAFFDCSGLTGTLAIGKSVIEIGEYAFCDDGFTGELILPDMLNKIGQLAFYGCNGFSGSLTIPASMGWLHYSCFMNCSGLNDTLTIMGQPNICTNAFNGCSFTTIICKSNSYSYPKVVDWAPPYPEGTKAFSTKLFSSATLYVPFKKLDTYKSANCWKDFTKIYSFNAGEVILNVNSITLNSGENYQLIATISPENTLEKDILWSVADTEIAEVDENGLVTAKKFGYTTVTAKTYSGVEATCKVSVRPVLATNVLLNREEVDLHIAENIDLIATVLPENTTFKAITWESNNENIAKVDINGTVTAITIGEAVITASCGDATATCKVKVKPISPLGVVMNVENINLPMGQTYKLTATVEPENTTDKTIAWSSSNEEVATVSEDGAVTAISFGETTITATCGEASATCRVTVNPVMATSVVLDKETLELVIGGNETLTATVEPENTTDKTIVWSSSNEEVATVSEDGGVTAISVGMATITAKCGDVSATCKVTVKPILATSIILNKETLELVIGENETLTATVEPENTTYKTIVWSSSNEEIATVSEDGVVTAVSIGEATITATCGDVSATCTVTVSPRLVESIKLDHSKWIGMVGESFVISVTVIPDNATDKTVIWNSSDLEVATVDETGLVTAVKPGTAIITASAANGLTSTCEVTVLPILVESIILNPNEIQGLVGESFTIEATVLPENASTSKIEWKSTNPTVATVNQSGYVEILKDGSCRIIATAIDGSNVSAECLITGTSGIESIFADVTDHISVYTPSGMLVKKDCSSYDLKNLVPGIYVLKSETKTIKVILR